MVPPRVKSCEASTSGGAGGAVSVIVTMGEEDVESDGQASTWPADPWEVPFVLTARLKSNNCKPPLLPCRPIFCGLMSL